jgi:hypothetical protein
MWSGICTYHFTTHNATQTICSYYVKVLHYSIYQSNDNHEAVTCGYSFVYDVCVTNEQEEEQYVRQKIKT